MNLKPTSPSPNLVSNLYNEFDRDSTVFEALTEDLRVEKSLPAQSGKD